MVTIDTLAPATLFDNISSATVPPPSREPLLLRQRTSEPVVAGPQRVPPRHRNTLLAIDGDSIVHRAFHAYGDDALYGVLALLAGVADKTPFDAVVVGFDDADSWRREEYPLYKAQRPDKPTALIELLVRVPEVLREMGIAVLSCHGHEADDVLGSAAGHATAQGWCSVLVTSDRDAYGLVDDDTTVLRLRSGLDNAMVITPQALRAMIGIEPAQYVEFAALRGDPSDNLPGISGIGPRTARELLQAFPTIAAAVADEIGCMSVIGRGVGKTLIEDMAADDSTVMRNVRLMTIRRDLAVDAEACAQRLPYDAVERWCAGAGLGAVARRMAAAFGGYDTNDSVPLPAGPG